MNTKQPRLSSAVILLRDASTTTDTNKAGLEVFMVRRVVQSEFMPDVYVFPGGSVQAEDLTIEQAPGLCQPVIAHESDPANRTVLGTGVRVAAIRELFEEAGVLLAYQYMVMLSSLSAPMIEERKALQERAGNLLTLVEQEHLELATDVLHYFTRWITPAGMGKRFDTHFFLAAVPEGQQPVFDNLETSAGLWISPADALARYDQDDFPLVFATMRQLQELLPFTSVTQILAHTTHTPVATRSPILADRHGQAVIYLPEDPQNLWPVPTFLMPPSS